jgi:hypothetical protein
MVAAAIIGGAVVGGVATTMAGSDAADAVERRRRQHVEPEHSSTCSTRTARTWPRGGKRERRRSGRCGPEPHRAGTTTATSRWRTSSEDPGYQFRMDQGEQALERSAAARGGLTSGGTGMALERYGQDYASGEYSNAYNRFNNDRTTRFNRLASIAGVGQTAATQTANMGTQVAGQVGENQIGAGNARAAGYMAGGNAISGGANNIGNYFMMRQFLGNGGGGGGMPPNPFYGTSNYSSGSGVSGFPGGVGEMSIYG